MLQLKHHPLARRKRGECFSNLASQFPPHQIAFGIRSRPYVGELFEAAVLLARGIDRDRSFFFPNIPFSQMIEAEVGNYPVNPGVEGTLKPETAEVFVGF